MTQNDATPDNSRFRHTVRPLSLFTFCGETIGAPREEYQQVNRNLPPCPECRRVRDEALMLLGGKRRRMSIRQPFARNAGS